MRDSGLDEIPPASETAHWFYEQLLAALEGQPGSLPMYKTVHNPIHRGASGESAIVVVASFTGLHAVRAEIVSGRWVLRDIGRWDNLAALTSPKSLHTYFDCIARCIKPCLTKPFHIGLCLPFPLETMDGTTVARPAPGTQLSASLDGADAAHEMLLALKRADVPFQGTVCAVAAAVAVLLSAEVLPGTSKSNTAALITEGGGQIAYFEQPHAHGQMVAVTAALGYPSVLTAINAVSRMPEPLISANLTTLGGLTLLHARAACDSGCFTPGAARQLRSIRKLTSNALCTWLDARRPEPTMDEKAFYTIGYRIIQHIGRRLAASSAGILRRVTRHTPDSVSFVVVHGATFSNSRLLREHLQEELASVDLRYSTASWHLAQVANDLVIGTACAALQYNPSNGMRKRTADAV